MPLLVRDANQWKTPQAIHVRHEGQWKQVQTGYVRRNGQWVAFYTSLQPPTNIRVSRRGYNRVRWNWDAVAGADYYEVRRSGSISTVRSLSYNLARIYQNVGYQISVRAVKGEARSAWAHSPIGRLLLYSAPPVAAPVISRVVPTPPPFNNQVIVDWNRITNAALYLPEWKQTTETNWRNWQGQTSSGTTIGHIVRGEPYQFRVRAVNHLGATAYSNIVTITLPV